MKILHATHHFWPCIGGIERAIEDLCIELIKKGHKCKVLCLNKCARSQKKLPEREIYKDIEIVRVPFLDLKYYKIALSALKHASNVDIIHVHGIGFFSDFFLLTKFIHKKPVVVSSYGGIFHTGTNLLKQIYFFLWCKFLLRFAGRVIVISQHDKELFRKIVPEEKIASIAVPVRVAKYKQKMKEKNSFVFVGRLSKNKRVDRLIDIFIKSTKHKKAKLYIIGPDFEGLLPKLKEQVKKAKADDKIKFLGKVDDKELAKILSKTEFFVSASAYESFGISVIEAMGFGNIPVLSDIPTFRSFVSESRCGFIIDFDEEEKAVEEFGKVFFLSKSKKEAMRKGAISYSKKFSPEKIAKRMKTFYFEIFKRRCQNGF